MGWANFKQVLLQPLDFTLQRLCVMCPVKLALAALAQTSGLPGGLFAPSMFAGAAAGGAFGRLIGAGNTTATGDIGKISRLLLGGVPSDARGTPRLAWRRYWRAS